MHASTALRSGPGPCFHGRRGRTDRRRAGGFRGGNDAAVEVPPPGGGFYIQTSGANAGTGIGDWYSSNTVGAGNGYNYLLITVPCGWPSATPLQVDLFSPEINANAVASSRDEPRGAGDDTTEFELYGPGAVVGPGYNLPAPGTGSWDTTYAPRLRPARGVGALRDAQPGDLRHLRRSLGGHWAGGRRQRLAHRISGRQLRPDECPAANYG